MENLKRWRRELHQIPEIGLKEYQTAAYIRKELEAMGYQWKSILETGTYVFIDYGCQETLAFRSDIDALKICEKNKVDYQSQFPGYMHACGHDGHMSALLGFAKKLKDTQDVFSYNILLIFQPGEESPGGAKLIVEDGLFDRYHVKAIFGMHLMPMIDEGIIACKKGPLMAMCGEIDVKIHGKSSHAGLPQNGVDSIVVAAKAIDQYQSLISRMMSPFQPIVLNIGQIQGGTARNIVAGETSLHGTLRVYDEQIFDDVVSCMHHIHQGLEIGYHCQIDMTCPPMYPPVINDANLYDKWKLLVSKERYIELEEPLMLAEDFSFYQKKIPGIFFFLGTKCHDYQSGLHTETFDFHEEVLKTAVDVYYATAKGL